MTETDLRETLAAIDAQPLAERADAFAAIHDQLANALEASEDSEAEEEASAEEEVSVEAADE